MGQPTRQDPQTWKSGENISTLTKRTRTSDPCDACLLSSAVIFSCVGFSQRQPPMNLFCLRSILTQNLKRKAGMASAPQIFAYGQTDGYGGEGLCPPLPGKTKDTPKREEGLCPPFSDPEENTRKARRASAPHFPNGMRKGNRSTKHFYEPILGWGEKEHPNR